MIIAVTGGRGLLGRVVADLAVRQGHDVVCIDRAQYEPATDVAGVRYESADITRYDSLERAVGGVDAMVHLAAYVSPDAAADHIVHNNNVVASFNALSVSVAAGITRVCLASSVNAIGGAYSRAPRYDYFPLDEKHPSYAEDPYGLSKWIAEQQAAAFARRYETMTVACLRMHALRERAFMAQRVRDQPGFGTRDLWGYTPIEDAARACLAAVTAPFVGHETFYIVATDTASDEESMTLRDRHYPEVRVTGDLSGRNAFFSNAKAVRLLNLTVGAR